MEYADSGLGNEFLMLLAVVIFFFFIWMLLIKYSIEPGTRNEKGTLKIKARQQFL